MGNKRGIPQIKDIRKEAHIGRNKTGALNYPIFSFKYLQEASVKDSADASFFIDFLFRLKKLSELGWEEIRTSQKHSFGTSQIPINSIIPKISHTVNIVTPDVKHLTVFRASGNNRTFLGIQEQNIFHIIFIEAKFNTVYPHN